MIDQTRRQFLLYFFRSDAVLRWAPLALYMTTWTGVRASLVLAVIDIESSGDPKAVSPRGALGLMQIMPVLARSYGVDERRLFEPELNVWVGSVHLKRLLSRYNLIQTLGIYHSGENGARKKFPSNYVKRVVKKFSLYERILKG